MGRRPGSKNRLTLEDFDQESSADSSQGNQPEKFTGIARSIECVKWNGFQNFYIVTLTLKEGVVMSKKYSEPYAMFEAIAKLDHANHISGLKLMTEFQNGKSWSV